MDNDPYDRVRQEVLDQLVTLNKTLRESDDPNLAGEKTPLKTIIQAIRINISDLNDTITIVKHNRRRFPTITDDELGARSVFVAQITDELNELASSIATTAKTRSPMPRVSTNNRSSTHGRTHSEPPTTINNITRPDNKTTPKAVVAPNEQQTYKAREEIELSNIQAALERLADQSAAIGEGIQESVIQLGGVNEQLEEAGGSVRSQVKRLLKHANRSESSRYVCIIVLCIMIIVLIGVLFLPA